MKLWFNEGECSNLVGVDVLSGGVSFNLVGTTAGRFFGMIIPKRSLGIIVSLFPVSPDKTLLFHALNVI